MNDPRRSFGSMGLSSLLAVELRNQLEATVRTFALGNRGMELSDGRRAGCTSRAEAYRASTAKPQSAAQSTPQVAVPTELANIVELSDEDALTQLRAARSKERR